MTPLLGMVGGVVLRCLVRVVMAASQMSVVFGAVLSGFPGILARGADGQ